MQVTWQSYSWVERVKESCLFAFYVQVHQARSLTRSLKEPYIFNTLDFVISNIDGKIYKLDVPYITPAPCFLGNTSALSPWPIGRR